MEVQSFEEFVDLVNFENFTFELNNQQPVQFDGTSDFLQTQEDVKPVLYFFLKPAKSREDQYEGGNFPTTMLCTPYKYDLKVVGELDAKFEQNLLSLELVDAETKCKPDGSPSETRPGVVIESVESFNPKEKIIRFALNWCSFHFRKRAFCLKLVYKDSILYISTPFHTYARRRDTPYSMPTISGRKQHTLIRHVSPLVSQVQQQVQQQFLAQQHVTPMVSVTPKNWVNSYPRMGEIVQRAATSAPVSSLVAPTPHFSSHVPFMSSIPISSSPTLMHSHVLNCPNSFETFQQIPHAYAKGAYSVPSPQQQQEAASPPSPSTPSNMNNLLISLERTTMAIQLISSLSPMEREAVNYYLSSSNNLRK